MKWISTVTILLIMATGASAQDRNNPVETKIAALEKAWNQAYRLRDKKALAGIFSDSIILVNDDGKLYTRSTFLAGVDSSPASDEQQAEPESISVHVLENVAIATGIYRTKGVTKGKVTMKRNRFVDTWVSKGDSWVCIAASATPILQ